MSDSMFTLSPILVLTSRLTSLRPLFHYHWLTTNPFQLEVYLFKAPFSLPLVNHESASFVGLDPARLLAWAELCSILPKSANCLAFKPLAFRNRLVGWLCHVQNIMDKGSDWEG